jgi:ubiquinone/menaquinone biosynthesis C-methylase UbiE
MDYDKTTLPDRYDSGRFHGQEVLELWMRTIASHVPREGVSTILDLGCGTGRFSNALAEHFGARVVGVDPSLKMLEQARAKPHDARVEFQRAHAEAIPLATGSVDLVFMSMSFHHFNEPAKAARECRRVLRADGTLFIRTGVSDRANAYPYTRFFPSTFAFMQEHLPSVARIRETFENAGLRTVLTEIVDQVIAPDWNAYADKLSTVSDSILARLTPEEFNAGVAAIRSHDAANPNAKIIEPIDVLVFRQ